MACDLGNKLYSNLLYLSLSFLQFPVNWTSFSVQHVACTVPQHVSTEKVCGVYILMILECLLGSCKSPTMGFLDTKKARLTTFPEWEGQTLSSHLVKATLANRRHFICERMDIVLACYAALWHSKGKSAQRCDQEASRVWEEAQVTHPLPFSVVGGVCPEIKLRSDGQYWMGSVGFIFTVTDFIKYSIKNLSKRMTNSDGQNILNSRWGCGLVRRWC